MEIVLGIVLVIFAVIAILHDTFTRDRPQFHHFKPGTVSDPDVAAMVKRQLNYGQSLRKQGKSILRPLVDGHPRGHGKSYRPALTMKQPDIAPPMAGKVTPIRRAKEK